MHKETLRALDLRIHNAKEDAKDLQSKATHADGILLGLVMARDSVVDNEGSPDEDVRIDTVSKPDEDEDNEGPTWTEVEQLRRAYDTLGQQFYVQPCPVEGCGKPPQVFGGDSVVRFGCSQIGHPYCYAEFRTLDNIRTNWRAAAARYLALPRKVDDAPVGNAVISLIQRDA